MHGQLIILQKLYTLITNCNGSLVTAVALATPVEVRACVSNYILYNVMNVITDSIPHPCKSLFV